MVTKVSFLFLVTSLLFAACSPSAPATPAATQPPVVADSAIVAEGRIEPVNYADVAFNAGGVISNVLVKEGDQVKKGDVLIRLGNEADKAYTAAQLELVTAQQEYDNLLNSSGTEAAQAVIDLKQAKDDYDDAVNYLHYLQTSKKVPQTEARRFLV